MSTLLTIAAIVLFTIWFALTAIVQLPVQGARRLKRFDPVGLFPGWHFFSPKPVQSDFAVLYRSWKPSDSGSDFLAETAASGWCELGGLPDRRLTDGVINPGRYLRKSILSCCDQILSLLRATGGSSGTPGLPAGSILLSLPYIILVERVSALCTDASAAQFRIDVILYDGESPRATTVFQSAVHRVVSRKECEVVATQPR